MRACARPHRDEEEEREEEQLQPEAHQHDALAKLLRGRVLGRHHGCCKALDAQAQHVGHGEGAADPWCHALERARHVLGLGERDDAAQADVVDDGEEHGRDDEQALHGHVAVVGRRAHLVEAHAVAHCFEGRGQRHEQHKPAARLERDAERHERDDGEEADGGDGGGLIGALALEGEIDIPGAVGHGVGACSMQSSAAHARCTLHAKTPRVQ